MASPTVVTWIKVEKPVFDLIGVVLSSLKLTGLVALAALALGTALGAALIRRRRRAGSGRADDLSLHLEARP
jgi:hypothetical protein